jgi:Lon protease-like protein
MLEIRAVRMLPDGRSLVHTWGVTRFRILERGMRDGYMVARVEQ